MPSLRSDRSGAPCIKIDPGLVKDTMPVFESGYQEKLERAFALLGEKTKETHYRIKELFLVPKEEHGINNEVDEMSFEPVGEGFKERVREKTSEENMEFFGYLHLHPLFRDEFPLTECQLSIGDWERMKEKDEEVRGICVFPTHKLDDTPPPISAFIVFWHRDYAKPMTTVFRNCESYYGLYLIKAKDGWAIPDVTD